MAKEQVFKFTIEVNCHLPNLEGSVISDITMDQVFS